MAHNTTEQPAQEVPYGHCRCGCGKKTRVATFTDRWHGWTKGCPIRFVPGHENRQRWPDRFWNKVDKRGPDECWPWLGTKYPSGYGQIKFKHVTMLAHRISYELTYGPIADTAFICHTCNNCACVNPAHLYAGTYQSNVDDMIRCGNQRAPHGSANGQAKLTEEDVTRIRAEYAMGATTHQAIATRYGVSRKAISSIIHRVNWRHIP